MRTLAIATTYNRVGRRDGDEFNRECDAFAKLWGADVLKMSRSGWGPRSDRWPWNRRWHVEHFLKSPALAKQVDCVAVFGHGTSSRLICTGHRKSQAGRLADALSACLKPAGSTVVLYACSTGMGQHGFADVLWRELQDRGVNARVIAHTTRGHTTFNPFVEMGSTTGGTPLVSCRSPYWAAWRRRLREDQVFRLTFWARNQDDLIDQLLWE